MREGAGGGRGAVVEAASWRPDMPTGGGSNPRKAATRPEGGTEGGGRQQRGWSGGAAPAQEGEGGERRGGGTWCFPNRGAGLAFRPPLRASLHRERALALTPPSRPVRQDYQLLPVADALKRGNKQGYNRDLGSPLLSAHLS
jgi:hypothetical protein